MSLGAISVCRPSKIWRGRQDRNRTREKRYVVPPAGQTQYIPSLILSWAVNLVKLKNGKRVFHEAPIFLRGIYLRWAGRKI